MSYALIIPKSKFNDSSVEVTNYYLDKNKLWSINDGNMLLHFDEGVGSSFLNKIGIYDFGEKAKYHSFSQDDMLHIFRKYYQTGELFNILFESDIFDDEEIYDFKKCLKYGTKKTEEETQKTIDYLKYLTEDSTDAIWHFTIIKDNMDINIYRNSVIYASGRGLFKPTDSIVLGIYQEIFEALGKDFKFSTVEIKEKEKVDHPLKNSHKLLKSLFESANLDTIKDMGIADQEFNLIKEDILKYTKDLENKKIYK